MRIKVIQRWNLKSPDIVIINKMQNYGITNVGCYLKGKKYIGEIDSYYKMVSFIIYITVEIDKFVKIEPSTYLI